MFKHSAQKYEREAARQHDRARRLHPHPIVDPMTSPSRIMREWNDDVLAAVWKHSLEHHQIKDLEGVYTLELRRSIELSDVERLTCLDIVRYTSMDAYKASSMGWNSASKGKEMAHKDMMYILVRTENVKHDIFAASYSTDIIGFISFMIDYDDPPNQHRQVVYIYEVHIAEKFRGKGLGKWLMFTVEAMAQSVSINKTMLTVFRSNRGAMKAYEKMGYIKDLATPPDRKVRGRVIESDYMIYGKSWHGKTGEVRN